MDPKATLLALADAVKAKDFSKAVECLNNYYQWRLGGGFEPKPVDMANTFTDLKRYGVDVLGKYGDDVAATLANELADKLDAWGE